MKKSIIAFAILIMLPILSMSTTNESQIKGRCSEPSGDNCTAFCPCCGCPYYAPNHGGEGTLTKGICQKDQGGTTCGYNFENEGFSDGDYFFE